MKQLNRLTLFAYLALFFSLVASYDLYKDNVYMVALVAVILTFAGLVTWFWSVQPGDEKK